MFADTYSRSESHIPRKEDGRVDDQYAIEENVVGYRVDRVPEARPRPPSPRGFGVVPGSTAASGAVRRAGDMARQKLQHA